jgi:hypothetical protein
MELKTSYGATNIPLASFSSVSISSIRMTRQTTSNSFLAVDMMMTLSVPPRPSLLCSSLLLTLSSLQTHNIINVPISPMWHEQGGNGSHGTRSSAKTTGGSQISRSGRDAFKQAILQRLIPSLRAFSPDLILLSTGTPSSLLSVLLGHLSDDCTGFDPAAGDVGNTKHEIGGPAIGMNLRPIDFEWVTMELVKIADICCNGRLVSHLSSPPSFLTIPLCLSSLSGECSRRRLRLLPDPFWCGDP